MSDEKNLTTTTDNVDESVSRSGKYQPLQPGMYWKCTKEVQDGQKWTMEVGLTHLLVSVELVEDEPHTIVLRPHPSNKRLDHEKSPHRFLVDDFLDTFEPNYDFQSERDEEIAAIHGRIETIQKSLIERQSNPALLIPEVSEESEKTDFSLGLPDPSMNKDASIGTLVSEAANGKLEQIQTQAENQLALADAQAKWISNQTKTLADTVNELAPYYSEKAAAALAACKDAVDGAAKIIEAVKTMGLYTGTDVQVETIHEGEGAAADEPFHIFQRKLYMDEEYLIHISSGGADADDLPSFFAQLKADEALLNRIIPVQRGVVAMQFRRKSKTYSPDPIVNHFMNQKNLASWLVIRDGENIHWVYSPLGTHETPRMFPTKDDMDRPFRGYDGEKIKFKDVRFTGSLKHHDDIALHYKRLLILLFGLHDRLHLLGRFAAEADGHLNFLDEKVQERIFKFVADCENNLLDDGRPSWSAYVSSKNALLQPGSRVVAIWRNLMNPTTCPSNCERWEHHHSGFYHRYEPQEDFGVRVVAKEKKDMTVKVPVSGMASWRAENPTREFNAKVYINRYSRYDREGLPYLVLDGVKSSDIDYYLEDRASRADYLDYIEVLLAAREVLRKEEEGEVEMREALAQALIDGGMIGEGDNPDADIDTAILSWRAASRGKVLPVASDKNFNSVRNKLLDNLYVLAGKGQDRVALVEDLAKREGLKPLRLVVTGKNKLVLYSAPLDTEKFDLDIPFVWVKRIAIDELKTKYNAGTIKWVVFPTNVASETSLHEWPEAKEWEGLKETDKISHEDIAATLQASTNGNVLMTRLESQGLSGMEAMALFEEFEDFVDKHSKGMVETPDFLIPLGIARQDKHYSYNEEYIVPVLSIPATQLLWRYGPDSMKPELEEWADDTYARPRGKQAAKERMREFKPWVGFVRLPARLKEAGFYPESSLSSFHRYDGGFIGGIESADKKRIEVLSEIALDVVKRITS